VADNPFIIVRSVSENIQQKFHINHPIKLTLHNCILDPADNLNDLCLTSNDVIQVISALQEVSPSSRRAEVRSPPNGQAATAALQQYDQIGE
ncbi:unnamed protein product, partial [Didymodactylos carnosus]